MIAADGENFYTITSSMGGNGILNVILNESLLNMPKKRYQTLTKGRKIKRRGRKQGRLHRVEKGGGRTEQRKTNWTGGGGGRRPPDPREKSGGEQDY